MKGILMHLTVCCWINAEKWKQYIFVPWALWGTGKAQSKCTTAASQMFIPLKTEPLLYMYNNHAFQPCILQQ